MSEERLVRIISGKRLHYAGILYRRERAYCCDDGHARRLLRLTTDTDLPVFRETDEDEIDLMGMVVIDLTESSEVKIPKEQPLDAVEQQELRAQENDAKAPATKKAGKRIGKKKAADDVVEL